MGIHFEAFKRQIEKIPKHDSMDDYRNAKDFLTEIRNKTELIEYAYPAEDFLSIYKLTRDEGFEKIYEYMDESILNNGLITPMEVTGIEDNLSVSIVHEKTRDSFTLINCLKDKNYVQIKCQKIFIQRFNQDKESFSINSSYLYDFSMTGSMRHPYTEAIKQIQKQYMMRSAEDYIALSSMSYSKNKEIIPRPETQIIKKDQ